jgi:hypothetical protein
VSRAAASDPDATKTDDKMIALLMHDFIFHLGDMDLG